MTKFLIFSSFIICMFSCSSSDDSSGDIQQEEDVDVFGLKVGNTWKYHYYKNSQAPGQDPDYVFDGVESIHEVIGTTEINETEYFEIEIQTQGICVGCPPEGSSTQYLRVEDHKLLDENGMVHLFIGNQIGEEHVSSSVDENLSVMIAYSGESQFESNYGSYDNIHTNELFGVINATDEQSLSLDSIYISEEVGIVYRTCSAWSNPTPSTQQYLVEFTSN